jgi:hypothetical protein
MHFGTKSYLKSTRNHTAKQALNLNILSIKNYLERKKKSPNIYSNIIETKNLVIKQVSLILNFKKYCTYKLRKKTCLTILYIYQNYQ